VTVYVDDIRRAAGRAEIRGYAGRDARWSHLMADTPAELADVARQLGLRPRWLQNPGTHREHYDVTETVRRGALALGAQAITYPRGLAGLIESRRAQCECRVLSECRWGEIVAVSA
jgi:hypothetical protein